MDDVLESRPTAACDALRPSNRPSCILYLSQHGPTRCKHTTAQVRREVIYWRRRAVGHPGFMPQLHPENPAVLTPHSPRAHHQSPSSRAPSCTCTCIPNLRYHRTENSVGTWCEKSLGHRQRSFHVAKLGKPRPDSCSPLAGMALRLAHPCRATSPNPQPVRTAQISWILLARDQVRGAEALAWWVPSGQQLTTGNPLGAGVPPQARPRSPARPLAQRPTTKKPADPQPTPRRRASQQTELVQCPITRGASDK